MAFGSQLQDFIRSTQQAPAPPANPATASQYSNYSQLANQAGTSMGNAGSAAQGLSDLSNYNPANAGIAQQALTDLQGVPAGPAANDMASSLAQSVGGNGIIAGPGWAADAAGAAPEVAASGGRLAGLGSKLMPGDLGGPVIAGTLAKTAANLIPNNPGLGNQIPKQGLNIAGDAAIGAGLGTIVPGVGNVVGGLAGAAVGGGIGIYQMAHQNMGYNYDKNVDSFEQKLIAANSNGSLNDQQFTALFHNFNSNYALADSKAAKQAITAGAMKNLSDTVNGTGAFASAGTMQNDAMTNFFQQSNAQTTQQMQPSIDLANQMANMSHDPMMKAYYQNQALAQQAAAGNINGNYTAAIAAQPLNNSLYALLNPPANSGTSTSPASQASTVSAANIGTPITATGQ